MGWDLCFHKQLPYRKIGTERQALMKMNTDWIKNTQLLTVGLVIYSEILFPPIGSVSESRRKTVPAIGEPT